MHAYAQTNVQLFNQLRSEGYSEKDRERVREAYEFAMHLFTGLFLPSGKTFIDHLVGTASILASLHVSADLVIAGLIHAAYLHGDFGCRTEGISERKRNEVRDTVGAEVEKYVERYDRLLWTPQKMLTLRKLLHELSPVDRHVLLMRLANELEHELDFAGLYYCRNESQQRWKQRYLQTHVPIMAEMAEKLGFLSLACELTKITATIARIELPFGPCGRSKQKTAYLIKPKSYARRFRVLYYRRLLQHYVTDGAKRFYHRSSKTTRYFLRKFVEKTANI